MAMARSHSTRYTAVAMTLHWLIAAAIVVLLAAGLWMTDAIKQPETKNFAFKVYQWHKALGLTVLVLSVVRLAWRLANPPPPLPAGMTAFERFERRTQGIKRQAGINATCRLMS